MGSFRIAGKDAARQAAMKSIAAAKARAAGNITTMIHEIDEHIKALTPVYTGQAVRNYIWTAGAPNTTVYDAIEQGETGQTNNMPLGNEPRRAVNEAAAAQSLGALNLGNPFQTFYLTNLSPDIEGLELGILPGPPLSSRSPNGMFGLTQEFISTKYGSKGIL